MATICSSNLLAVSNVVGFNCLLGEGKMVASCLHPDLKLKFKSVRAQLGLIPFSPSSYLLIQFS